MERAGVYKSSIFDLSIDLSTIRSMLGLKIDDQ